ncbi:MAG: hypothetical protein V3T88_03205 [Nitrosomonadaceae bacterium]
MRELLEKLDQNINNFKAIIKEIEKFIENATDVGYYGLVEHSRQAVDGLTGVLYYLKEVERKIQLEGGIVKIPIFNADRPNLRVVKRQTTFKYPPSPIW